MGLSWVLMAESFTTWTQLKASLLQKLAAHVESSAFMTASVTTPDGASHTYRTIDELRLLIRDVNLEASTESRAGRTLFLQGVPPR